MTDQDKLAAIEKILSEQFVAGTRVINCGIHWKRALDARPKDCELCATDITNQLSFSIRVNEWLNARMDEIRKVMGGFQ